MNEYQAYLALKGNAEHLRQRANVAEGLVQKRAHEINNAKGTRRFECIGGFENIAGYCPDAKKQSTVKYIVVTDGKSYQEFEDGTRREASEAFPLIICLASVHSGMWREVLYSAPPIAAGQKEGGKKQDRRQQAVPVEVERRAGDRRGGKR